MLKPGPAFSDSISSERVRRYKRGGSGGVREIFHFLPLFILCAAGILLVFRLFYIQILRNNYFMRLSNENRIRTEILPAPRGIIFDIKKRLLVSNTPSFKLISGKSIQILEKDEALRLIAKGQAVHNDVQREYHYKTAFSHVVGYVGQISEEELATPAFDGYFLSDFVGKLGLEKQYEARLHGKAGKELFEVDARGKKIRSLGRQEATPGENIHTTLHLDVQLAAARALSNDTKGAVVVSDPRNGAILALYSSPTFDTNLFTHSKQYKGEGKYSSLMEVLSDSENQPVLNRATSGVYPPGSTFKLVTAIAALESGAITLDTKIEDTGVIRVGAFSYSNWFFTQYGKTEGQVDVVKAVARSNDIFFYKAAEETGAQTLAQWAKKLGLGTKLDIDLAEESGGTVPDPSWKKREIREPWYLGDTYNYGIGQGYLLTTPLQVNMLTVPFANDGVLYQPHLIQGKKTVLQKNFVNKKYRDAVRLGMKQSCERGGVAWPFFEFRVKNEKLQLDGLDYTEVSSAGAMFTRVSIGCKTGTAETYEKAEPHAWITVFAPYHKPEVVVTVLVEHAGEGSSVAAPIAKKILEEYFEKK